MECQSQECENQKMVADMLTSDQISEVKKAQTKQVILVGLESKQGSFQGYHPLNSKMPVDSVVKVDQDGKLDTVPIVVGG